MDIFTSHAALSQYFKKYRKCKCFLFSGTPPTNEADIPFNPESARELLLNAEMGCTLKSDISYGAKPVEHNVWNIVPDSTQDESTNITFRLQGRVPYVYYGNPIPFITYMDPERNLALYEGLEDQQAASVQWSLAYTNLTPSNIQLHETYWRYFEFKEEQPLRTFSLSNGQYTWYPYFQVEYFDESTQEWLSVIAEEDLEDPEYKYNIRISDDYKDRLRDGYTLINRNFSFPFNNTTRYGKVFWLELDTPVNTKRVRIRNGSFLEPRDPKVQSKSVSNHFVSFSTDAEVVAPPETITPTWAIIYSENIGEIGERSTGNDYVVVSVGTDETNDLVLNQATFNPVTTNVNDIFGQISIRLNQLLG